MKKPSLLQPEAYHGLAGEIVRLIEPETEADPGAIMGQLLTGFGNVCGRGSYFKTGASYHYPILFNAIVGPTATGRKGTSWSEARRPLGLAFPEWEIQRIKCGLSTGEGLIFQVRDPVEGMVKHPQTKVLEPGLIDVGVKDKRLLIAESEFASVLQRMAREGNSLSAVIRCAWDGGTLSTLTKGSVNVATEAHVSIIVHITPEELIRCLKANDISNGFGNRFLWVYSDRARTLPFPAEISDAAFSDFAIRLRLAWDFAQNAGQIIWAQDAARRWAGIYSSLSGAGSGIVGNLTCRAEAQVLRLALIYALLDMSNVITSEHLDAALAFWQLCEESVEYVFGGVRWAIHDRIWDAINGATGREMTRTELQKAFNNHASKIELDAALAILVGDGRARCELRTNTGGRAAEVWHAVP